MEHLIERFRSPILSPTIRSEPGNRGKLSPVWISELHIAKQSTTTTLSRRPPANNYWACQLLRVLTWSPRSIRSSLVQPVQLAQLPIRLATRYSLTKLRVNFGSGVQSGGYNVGNGTNISILLDEADELVVGPLSSTLLCCEKGGPKARDPVPPREAMHTWWQWKTFMFSQSPVDSAIITHTSSMPQSASKVLCWLNDTNSQHGRTCLAYRWSARLAAFPHRVSPQG